MSELDPNSYNVAWIAPLEIEAQSALHMLDERHRGRFLMGRGDDYVFHAGRIRHGFRNGPCQPGSEIVPQPWFGLLVGVVAGLPNLSKTPPRDIRLGGVLVALPDDESAGLFAYDLGKATGKDGFRPLGFGHVLATTETVVRSAIGGTKLSAPNDAEIFLPFYESIKDREHVTGTFIDPGSGEKLMRNARQRNELRDKYNIIGLEMEAAGTMNRIPVGVIRGVCDYGDEQKNKDWQPYAAAMAAAHAKIL
ncbi:hypothetical protein DL764_010229 [Monosporascus ibericus]|uniref:Nucleoside phosphorylase domain-containing protein n=1 Tax=Monosporascus ibericus TaxID=155417 RepID=A0A4V1X8R5_9PEZI|nr:hypothetical protein DL764_010229 [Monosporascus ibericus]